MTSATRAEMAQRIRDLEGERDMLKEHVTRLEARIQSQRARLRTAAETTTGVLTTEDAVFSAVRRVMAIGPGATLACGALIQRLEMTVPTRTLQQEVNMGRQLEVKRQAMCSGIAH